MSRFPNSQWRMVYDVENRLKIRVSKTVLLGTSITPNSLSPRKKKKKKKKILVFLVKPRLQSFITTSFTSHRENPLLDIGPHAMLYRLGLLRLSQSTVSH